MSWFWLIFIATNLFSISDLIDKYFCEKKFKNTYAFALSTFLASAVFIILLAFLVDYSGASGWSLWLGLATGPIYFLMWLFLWKALAIAEASRVIAVFNMMPVFNAFLAIKLLGEQLNQTKWLAIIFIVSGAILCSWEKSGRRFRFNRGYLLAVAGAFIAALGNVVSKVASLQIDSLSLYPISFLGGLPIYFFLLFKKDVWQETKAKLLDGPVRKVLFLRALLVFIAVVFFYLALPKGPISLIMAVNGTGPLLVFLYASLASKLWPRIIKEGLSRQALFAKALAIILIVSGVILISQ